MEIHKILQEIVNEPYESLVGMAKAAICDLLPSFNDYADDGNGESIMVAFFATSLAVDNKLTALEAQFCSDIFGLSKEAVLKLVQPYATNEMVNAVNTIVDSLDVKLKPKVLMLCACFLAADETISVEEVAFIRKLAASANH